jgi:hypothetical protein
VASVDSARGDGRLVYRVPAGERQDLTAAFAHWLRRAKGANRV